MSHVLGIDLSSFAVDLVQLDETTNTAEWTRVALDGKTASERLRDLRTKWPTGSYFDDIYLAAIEIPYGRGQSGTLAKLNRVFGAVVTALPAGLPLWEVGPHEWKKELGMREKPAAADLSRIAPDWRIEHAWKPSLKKWDETQQNGRDAFCLALYARQVNQRGLDAA